MSSRYQPFKSLNSGPHASQSCGLRGASQEDLYPALLGTHLLSKFGINIARNKERETGLHN